MDRGMWTKNYGPSTIDYGLKTVSLRRNEKGGFLYVGL